MSDESLSYRAKDIGREKLRLRMDFAPSQAKMQSLAKLVAMVNGEPFNAVFETDEQEEFQSGVFKKKSTSFAFQKLFF